MNEAEPVSQARRQGRSGPWLLLALAFVLGMSWLTVALVSGRALVAPDWLTERVEARAAESLGGPGRVELGGIVAVLSEGRIPRIVLRDIRLRNAIGADIARIPELRVRFSLEALLGGRLAITRLTVVGADLTLRRDRAGRFDLVLGTESRALRGQGSLPDALAAIDQLFDRPALAGLTVVSGEALRLTFQDALTSRVWRAENGSFNLTQEEGQRNLALGFALAGGAGAAPASFRISLAAPSGNTGLDLAAEIENVTAADLAMQVPALAWLIAADAPLSANFRGRIDGDGALESFDGALEIGKGAISPGGEARPIPFEGAKAYLSFDPAAGRISFSEVSAATPEARFRANGHALLGEVDPASGIPRQLIVQLGLSDIVLNPAGELAEPARFSSGAADLRLTISPFRIELGQLTLSAGERHFRASGDVTALAEGWAVALDLGLNVIPHDRLFALWPLRVVPKTREWLVKNVTEGLLYDVQAALRIRPGDEPRLGLGYEFRNGTVRFLPTLAPIIGGSGHATIHGTRYTMAVTAGEVRAPNGEALNTAGSTMTLANITIPRAPADIRLETESTIPAALSLLDEKPFEFLKKSGRETDLATGRARVTSRIRLPLVNGVQLPEIDFDVAGRLTAVRSDTLVPGRVLTAPALTLNATKAGLTIAGAGRIGEARFDATWTQPFAREAGGSQVQGSVALNQALLDEFGIALPRGTVTGEGTGQITLDLPRGAAPRLALTSTLAGVGLSIAALGWSKSRASTGSLEVAVQLGRPVDVERLALSAPGLSAEGRVDLTSEGAFAAARFSRVRVGNWLNAPVTLTSRGAGRAPAVAVTGGTIDLRETSFGGGGGSGNGGPITLALDRLIVAEGIVFTGLRADLSTQGGLNGRFTGRLAGEAPVEGALAPSQDGTSVRLRSADAGAVLRSSGLLDTARQGTFDLTLVPLPGEGRYDGRLAISDLSLRGAPVLADILGAISVVGLLEQLNGQGILFSEVTGEFTLDPRGITLRRGSAVGTSLGVSMAGVYDLRTKVLDMQGTISPIYMLNSIGQIFTRRGEGLFGFNYRMTGPAANPRTSVNPLSILTPGMFREIFRTAPPELAE